MYLQEKDSWASTCKAGGKYYLTRNTTTLIAFAIGEKWQVCIDQNLALFELAIDDRNSRATLSL
jgi:aspartyl aminopeptidase